MPESAAIICTRNRHDALLNTLSSIAEQDLSPPPVLIVVDGSDNATWTQNKNVLSQFSPLPLIHHRYEGPPSAAKQRNVGLQLLPDTAEQIFFLDDDITLTENCLQHLSKTLTSSTCFSGVGGLEVGNPPAPATSSWRQFWKYVFLLDHPEPGRVLLSGHISLYNSLYSNTEPISTQWLSTCCCLYDRAVFDHVEFDESLSGALYEDRDLSYRAAQFSDLAVVPQAQFVHHRSPINRRSAFQFARDRTIQRYWFVKKNITHPLRKPAYWWATLGQLLAALTSSKVHKWETVRGRLQGIQEILWQTSPLLQSSDCST